MRYEDLVSWSVEAEEPSPGVAERMSALAVDLNLLTVGFATVRGRLISRVDWFGPCVTVVAGGTGVSLFLLLTAALIKELARMTDGDFNVAGAWSCSR